MLKILLFFFMIFSYSVAGQSSWSISIALRNGSRSVIHVPYLSPVTADNTDSSSGSCTNCFNIHTYYGGRRMVVLPCKKSNCTPIVNSTSLNRVHQPTIKYNLKNCGMVNKTYDSAVNNKIKLKISTGDENILRPGEYPWLVRIESRSDIFSRTITLCAGTLIHPQWIVTAAHCMFDNKKNNLYPTHGITLYMGHYNRITTSQNEHVAKPILYLVHPDFRISLSSPAPVHDLALIKLENPVPLSRSIGIACLPERTDQLNDGTLAFTAGWGHASLDSTAVNEPRKARIKVAPKACRKLYINPSVHICGSNDRGSNICSGDSGAGLMVRAGISSKNNKTSWKWHIFGVASFGLEECSQSANHDNAFASVLTDVDWIRKMIKTY